MIKIFNKIYDFFDKLENKIRGKLSRHPITYALVGSIGTVSIWRGIWDLSDKWMIPGWVSAVGGVALSVMTGLFVSFFIGENIIISGLKKEKRIDEKTEEEIKKESDALKEIKKDIQEIKEILLKDKN